MPESKYTTGRYSVCPGCGERPCSCPAAAAPPAKIVALRAAPASGNAIPFKVWDVLISRHELSIVESGVLLYLCRETIGYGHHGGALITITEITAALRIPRSSTCYALERLSQLGLIERNRRYEPGKREHAATHIRVTLDES